MNSDPPLTGAVNEMRVDRQFMRQIYIIRVSFYHMLIVIIITIVLPRPSHLL